MLNVIKRFDILFKSSKIPMGNIKHPIFSKPK